MHIIMCLMHKIIINWCTSITWFSFLWLVHRSEANFFFFLENQANSPKCRIIKSNINDSKLLPKKLIFAVCCQNSIKFYYWKFGVTRMTANMISGWSKFGPGHSSVHQMKIQKPSGANLLVNNDKLLVFSNFFCSYYEETCWNMTFSNPKLINGKTATQKQAIRPFINFGTKMSLCKSYIS